MIKAENNVPIVGIEAHGEKVETTIRGNYDISMPSKNGSRGRICTSGHSVPS